MTNSKNTKRALLASILSIVLCFAMLVGTTFAWFTDSVTSSGNKIQAGKLDIVLEELQEGGYVDISDSDAPLFNQEALWEPGYSEAHVLRVVNNGNLALKYKMEIVVKNAVPGVNLADVIEVYAYNPAGAAEINALPTSFDEVKNSGASDPSTGYKFVGTLSELMAKETGIAYGFMKKDSAPEYYGFVFHMKEEAGNEYQNLSIGDAFDIVLKATQWTYENDSFGPDYDANAVYPTVGLSAIQKAFKQNGLVVLGSDIAPDKDLIAQSKPIIDLNGKTIRFNNNTQNNGFGIKGNGLTSVITINGDGIVTSNPDGEPGSNEVEDGIVEGKQHGGYTVSATNKSKIIINGGHYVANVTAVYAISGGKVEINGGFFDYIRFPGSTLKGKYLLNLKDNTNSSIVVKGGTFVNFDPSNNEAEGPNTNFVAEGYTVQSATQTNGDIWYTVVPA